MKLSDYTLEQLHELFKNTTSPILKKLIKARIAHLQHRERANRKLAPTRQ